jgi:alpha-1,2-mannosyltransferase
LDIAIIHGFIGGGGGTEKTLLAIIEGFLENNSSVNLYSVSKPSIILKNIKVSYILPFKFPFFGIYQRYLESQLIKKVDKNALIIQASGGFSMPLHSNQKIIVYCHHDFQNESSKNLTKYKGIWSLYYKPYYVMSQKFLSQIGNKNIHLISNSKYIHDSIKKNFGKDSEIIYPPVDLDEFEKKVTKKNKVITLGRYSQEKNFEFILDVMNRIEAPCIMIGNTKTKANKVYYTNLIARAAQKAKNVILLKNIERNEVIKHLLEAKIYFHAAAETFGISVVESIAAGCIPIVPNNSAHVETVPFKELRYQTNDLKEAQKKIMEALEGKYDYLLKSLQESLVKYDKENFKKSLVNYAKKI